jgi:cell division protein FtsB
MSATGSYARPTLADPTASPPRPRRPEASPDPGDPGDRLRDGAEEADPTRDSGEETRSIARPDLTGLSVAGITRSRVGWVSAALVAAWIVVVFARQVGDAQAATNRATQLAADNDALAAEVQQLQNEVDLVTKPGYVAMEARGFGLGNPREIPFTLDPSVPAPVDGAPGSAAVRLGTATDHQTPLESWLQLLFGSSG